MRQVCNFIKNECAARTASVWVVATLLTDATIAHKWLKICPFKAIKSYLSFLQLNRACHMHVNIMHWYMHVNFYQIINKTAMKCFVRTVLIERARAKTLPLKILNFKNVPVLKVNFYKCIILIKQLAHVSLFQRSFHKAWWSPLYLNENQCNS